MGKIADALRGVALSQQQRRQILALDQEFSSMEVEAQALKAKQLHLEAKVNPLEREITRLKEKTQESPLKFEPRIGTYYNESEKLHYCSKCFSNEKRSPLKVEATRWTCPVCGAYYMNPDAVQRRPRTADPGGWQS